MTEKARCRSCGAEIIWALTLLDKKIPLDVEPSEKGNVLLTTVGGGKTPVAITLNSLTRPARDAAKRHDVELRTAHFVTCPQRDRWRK